MKLLDRYIGRTVLTSTAVVMLVLLALFAFATFAGELEKVGQVNYGLWEAAQYSLLLLPRLAYQLFPLTVLLGSIIGLGMLASNSELIVIRAAGVSLRRIIVSVMKAGVILMALMIVIGEFLAPAAEVKAMNLKAEALSEKISFRSSQGLWVRDGNRVVHIRELVNESEVGSVSIYEFGENNSMKMVTQARKALYDGENWQLLGVAQSSVDVLGVDTVRADTLNWQSLLSPKMISVVTVKPEFLSLTGLLGYIDYLETNGLESGQYVMALWRKAAAPLATAVMIFLAVPFVFGSLRSVGIGQRIFVGTLLGIGFYLLDQTVGQMGLVYQLPPLLAVSVAPAVFLILAIFLMRQVR